MTIQSELDVLYQSEGYAGTLARPVPQACYEEGKLHVASGGDAVKPGWGLVYDQSEEKFKVPTTDAEELAVQGVCSYDMRAIPSTLAATPTNANSPQSVQFTDDALVRVCIEGVLFVRAGGNMEFGDALKFSRNDGKWDKIATPTTIAAIPRLSVICLTKKAKDGDLIHARITLASIR